MPVFPRNTTFVLSIVIGGVGRWWGWGWRDGVHEGPIRPMDKYGHNFQPYWLIGIKIRHIIINRISVRYYLIYLILGAYSL